jgi:hypothetical protein
MHQILYSLFDMKISRISFHLSMILKFLELRVLYNFARESEFVVSRIYINQSYRVVYMIPLSRDEMRGGIILTDWNKSRFMIQQNYIIILAKDYLTIIRRRWGDYRGIFTPRRSRGEYSPIIIEPEANNCFSIVTQVCFFVFWDWIYFTAFAYFLISNFHKTASRHFVNFGFVIFTCRWI